MVKVQNEMATRIAIDTVSAANSLKGLQSAVSSATNAWKAQETALKSAGDSTGAIKAKYDGLSDVIERQKSKINELKSRQAGLDVENQKDAETYLKLQKQIDSSTKQLASYEAQQQRAKSSMTYYTSGLAELQKGYRQTNEVSKSFVERLQAEGKAEEANKAKMSGLKQSLANLSSQYSKQQEELKRVANESGATSDAYKRQQVRLNETGTAMAKTKTEMNELRESMNKKPSGFMDGIKGKLTDVNDKAEKTSHLFGTILGAHLVANGITNVLASIQAHFSELKDSVVEYNNKQQTMKATWDTLTGSDGAGTNMVNIGNKLATAYNQNIDIVDELNQSFYHVFDNAPETEKLTKSVLTLGDTLNLSDENVTRLGTNFTHMLSSGKMQLGDFNMINDQLPMYAEKMLDFEKRQQKNSKLTMSELRKQMSAGKISAKDAEAVMNSLGDKYQKASENLMKTIPGMERSIKTQMPALVNAIYQPIANMKSPLIGQATKWIQDPQTKKEFAAVGDALQLQMKDIMEAFGGKKFDVGNGLDSFLFNLQTGIDKLGATIVAHKDQIKELFSSLKTASKTSFSVLVQTLKDLEPVLKIVGKLASDHPKIFAAIAANGLLASKAISGLALAFNGLGMLKDTSGKLADIGKRMIFKPKVDGTEGEKELTLFARAIKGTASAIWKSLKWTAKIAWSGAKKSVSLLWSGIKGTGKLIGKGISFTAKIAVKGAQLAMAGLLKTAKVTGAGLKLAFNFLKANPFILIVTAIVAVVAALVELYKHNAKFRKFVNGLVKAAQDCWKNVTKFFKNLWKDTVKVVTNMYKGVTGWFGNMKKGISNHVSNTWKDTKKLFGDGWKVVYNGTKDGAKTVAARFGDMKKWATDHTSNMWKSTKSTFKDGISTVGNWTKDHAKDISNKFNNMRSWTTDTVKDMMSKNKATFKDGYKVTQDYTSTWNDIMHGKWNKVGNDLKNIARNLTKFQKDIFKGMYDKLNSLTGGRLGDILNTFKSIFDKIKGVVSGAVSAVHRSFTDIVRGVLKPFNDMLSGLKKGINWVLDKVGADKIGGSWSVSMPSYAQGTKDTHKGGLALVNDGQGANYREMYQLPGGQIGMFPKDRNMIVPLPKGTSVLDGDRSASFAKMLGIPAYKKGKGIGSFFSGMWDKGKDILDDVDKIIAHPIDFLSGVFKKFVGGISSDISLASDIITHFPATVAKNATKWIKDLFNNADGGFGDAGGAHGNPGGAGVARWRKDVVRALKANGFSASGSQVNAWMKVIARESNGNPRAINLWDSNAKKGVPSMGLVQTIGPTFNSNKFPGHGDVYNGYDDLLAGIHYAAATYGRGPHMFARVSGPLGYANGGIIGTNQMIEVAEGNKKEAVIPMVGQSARAWSLLKEVVDNYADGQFSGQNVVSKLSDQKDKQIENLTQKIEIISEKFDTVLLLMKQQIKATTDSAFSKDDLYRRQALDSKFKNIQTY
ncbi:tape measure protein [Liquorilactobacillus capillatus]|uniref:Tape measure protein n=1 Tax=Liquorilactobacillus capillatus DSM 19910 TaxID=1423731 RepID=A0A0R1M3C0_9LACO|nr:tape measure protein [Liquorilactobacillus capillatus]KRL02525.1 tape measure protein [Liquorilactobacillus capillatus DSM 19910]